MLKLTNPKLFKDRYCSCLPSLLFSPFEQLSKLTGSQTFQQSLSPSKLQKQYFRYVQNQISLSRSFI
jgi:hypothetical protein